MPPRSPAEDSSAQARPHDRRPRPAAPTTRHGRRTGGARRAGAGTRSHRPVGRARTPGRTGWNLIVPAASPSTLARKNSPAPTSLARRSVCNSSARHSGIPRASSQAAASNRIDDTVSTSAASARRTAGRSDTYGSALVTMNSSGSLASGRPARMRNLTSRPPTPRRLPLELSRRTLALLARRRQVSMRTCVSCH